MIRSSFDLVSNKDFGSNLKGCKHEEKKIGKKETKRTEKGVRR